LVHLLVDAMNKVFLCCFLCLFISAKSNSQNTKLHVFHDLEIERSDYPWTNQQTIVKGDAHSGTSFSRTDSSNQYGIGWRGNVPVQFQSKNIQLSVSGFTRISSPSVKASIVISILKNDSTVYWENRPLNPGVKNLNEWTLIREDVKLPATICGSDYTLLIYLWNENGVSSCDLDDLELLFNELEFPSYMIPSDTVLSPQIEGDFLVVYSGKYFKLEYEKYSSRFRILSSTNKMLMHSFSFFTSWSESDSKNPEIKNSLSHSFFLRADSLTEEGRFINFDFRSEACSSKLKIFFSDSEALINFQIESTFLLPVFLYRQSFSASYEPELKEVYRNYSFLDTNTFQDEYWLSSGGFQVLSDNAGFILYHPEDVSSVQIRTDAKRFCVNLDWEMDHPLMHWPILKGIEKSRENHSSSYLKEGDVTTGLFRIVGVTQPVVLPRLMNFSKGRTGAILWTEHADYSDLRLQRAVNFGSDTIVEAKDATAGFVKHHIPVTKSVFYSNPDKEMNIKKLAIFNSEIANVKGSPGFKEFLIDLQNAGQEICLHTPDQYTSSRTLLREALDYFRQNFKSRSWIDHGYDNMKKSNREDLVCDGLTVGSEHYSLDLWQEYGLRYFWNCFYEDTSLYSALGFYSFMSQPYRGWGDRFPVPQYWEHPTRSKDLIHWATNSTFDPPDGSMWDYFFSDQRLEDLLQSRDIKVLHVYPARADSANGFYEFRDGHFYIQETFESALARQGRFRDSGRLEIASVKDYFGFQSSLEKVNIRPIGNGIIVVENKSDADLEGISFAIGSATVRVPGKDISSRIENNETFYWFDLNKGESVNIEIDQGAK